jgi:HlyD family secretion protein
VSLLDKVNSQKPAYTFFLTPSVSADTLLDEATHQPYYMARLRIDQGSIARDLASKLTPGMPADVLISTGQRTMLQYLVQPLTDRIATSMRER